jgi:quercetin dioxygenase-like cupin family protein
MEIKRSGSQPSAKGPAEWFTGTVRIDPLFDAPVPARAAGASVTFEPGARTAWHTHPLGQTLIVTSGVGRAQRWGGPIEEIRPGDVVWFSPGEKHWHGAAPTTAMTHIAIQEKLDGKPVDWLEHVTPEQYEGRSHERSTADTRPDGRFAGLDWHRGFAEDAQVPRPSFSRIRPTSLTGGGRA